MKSVFYVIIYNLLYYNILHIIKEFFISVWNCLKNIHFQVLNRNLLKYSNEMFLKIHSHRRENLQNFEVYPLYWKSQYFMVLWVQFHNSWNFQSKKPLLLPDENHLVKRHVEKQKFKEYIFEFVDYSAHLFNTTSHGSWKRKIISRIKNKKITDISRGLLILVIKK